MGDCHSLTTVSSRFQILLCMYWKKKTTILTNITSLLLFVKKICGILNMRAAKSPIPSLILHQAVQGAEVDPYLAKQLDFCISVAGGSGNLHYLTRVNFPHWQWHSPWECTGNCTAREKPAKVHAAHSIPQLHQLYPSAVPLKGLATTGSTYGHYWVSGVYNLCLLSTVIN